MSVVAIKTSPPRETTPSGMPIDPVERLKAAAPSQATTELKAMAVAFATEMTTERAATYFEAIDGEPIWAIKQAAKEFRTGMVPNRVSHSFMPTPAEFGFRVRQITKPHRETHAMQRVRPVDPATLPKPKEGTPEERAQRAAAILAKHGYRELADKCGGQSDVS